MAILYRSYTVWSCATGRVPGGDHLPTGELYRGIIYFRHIDSVGDMHRLSIILNDGTEVKIHHEQQYTGNDRIRIYRRGITQDGYYIIEVEPQVQVPERYMVFVASTFRLIIRPLNTITMRCPMRLSSCGKVARTVVSLFRLTPVNHVLTIP